MPKVGANRGNAGKGRPKGVPNKMTATVKAVLHEVFEKRGGVDAMLSWSYEEPTAFYTLYGRMLPQEQHVSGANGAPLGVVILPAVKQ